MTDRPPPDADEFLEVMRDTRSRYVAGFSDQLDHLRSLASGAATPERLLALRTVAHRLAGLSGTVGFRSVGTHAGELEALVDAAVESSVLDTAKAFAAIQSIGEAFTRDLASPPSWSLPEQAAGPQARILVVEDDDDQRAIVRSALEAAGYTTEGVSSGDAAVEAARRERPALILLDVHLPGMDGYSVCRHLKAGADTRAIPIVFATTRAALNERLAGLALGADDYLTKPLDMRELLIRVRRLIQRRTTLLPAPVAEEDTLRHYESWLAAARAALDGGRAAIAMLRVTEDRHAAVAAALSENLRRRDVIGVYDRTHLLVLMPGLDAAGAHESIDRVAGSAGEGLQFGVAAGESVAPDALIADADDALVSARHAALQATGEARAGDSGRSILLADDDPDVMRILDAHMRSLGFTTSVAFDGHAAVAALAARPDVIVLDLMMPKLTGFEVLQQMSQLDGPKPKSIVLSARGREEDVTRAFDLGADDYMVKPFSPQELGARIGRLLR